MTRLSFYLSFMALADRRRAARRPRATSLSRRRRRCSPAAPGSAIARLKRAPLVLDVRDLWPAAATSLNQISTGRSDTRVAELLERELYRSRRGGRRGDAAVLRARRPDPGRPRAAHDADPERHAPSSSSTRRREPATGSGSPRARFLVTFAGMLGIAQALPSVLDAAERSNGRRRTSRSSATGR